MPKWLDICQLSAATVKSSKVCPHISSQDSSESNKKLQKSSRLWEATKQTVEEGRVINNSKQTVFSHLLLFVGYIRESVTIQ